MALSIITEHFLTDARSSYGRGRPLSARETIRREIEALSARKWGDPDERDALDDQIAGLRVRLAYLEEHPDEDEAS